MAPALNGPSGYGERWGPLGRALLDFHHGATAAQIMVHTDIWLDEPTPVEEFYRPDDRPLPELERTALRLCRGRTLDFGAGAGRHALELHRRGLKVTAIDVSPEAVEIMRDRGVTDARCGDFGAVTGESFDTIVLLMHGIGLVGTLEGLTLFFDHAHNHLDRNGQIIFDSADLGIVMPEQFDEGLGEWRSGGLYPGEVEYRLTYKDLEGEPYPWLFVDPATLADSARAAGLCAKVVARGARGSYLARVAR
jgi:SAM-dependent methyltransferase